MRASLTVASALGLCAALAIGGVARGDEPRPARVRTQVNVEVIDDARHVEDIISRMKSQPRAAAPETVRPEASKPSEPAAARPERPPLPEPATRSTAPRADKAVDHKVERRLDRRSDRPAAERRQGGHQRR